MKNIAIMWLLVLLGTGTLFAQKTNWTGERYSADGFSKGKEMGYGVLSTKEGKVIFEGEMNNGFYIKGTLYDCPNENVERYSGTFEHNEPSGFGQMWFKNGNYYIGFFYDGNPSGCGNVVLSDNTTYTGTFLQGKLSTGVGTDKDGKWAGSR